MRRRATLFAALTVLAVGATLTPTLVAQSPGPGTSAPATPSVVDTESAAGLDRPSALSAYDYTALRLQEDLAAVELFRPSYRFWRHIFTIPDGAVVFGSAVNGRLLARFPSRGDWVRDAVWEDQAYKDLLRNRVLPANPQQRREEVARLLEALAGPVVHNEARGRSLMPNAERYGAFLREWGAIYERFGVPADIGLAQAIVESGLSGTIRSEARAIGFCQWLRRNWDRLKQLSPHVIEGYNQTTQAPYCAAYLTILATRYGSFIPALSEHHAGGANVGRTIINGQRLGGVSVRDRYFLGAEFARDIRTIAPGRFRDVYGTYGPRSFFYAEMVFGNTANVIQLRSEIPQSQIFAIRTSRAWALLDITARTGLSANEVRRFNPALTRVVPARATLYLPRYSATFGRDVSFWHRPASPAYLAVLSDFVRLDASDRWETDAFDGVLGNFVKRFRATGTEEGEVMATTLAYVLQDRSFNRESRILADFRNSERILRLFTDARSHRDAVRATTAAAPVALD